MKRAWSASEQAVSSKKTRPLIGQPAKSANQRPYFLVGKSLNICPLCSFQKTVTLVSIYVFSSQYWGSTQSYRVYMKRNEFSPSYYTDLPFEAESGSIHSKWNHCGRESVWCQSVDIIVKDLLLWNFSFFVSFKKRWVTLLQNSDLKS